MDIGNVEVAFPMAQQMANSEVGGSPKLRSQSIVQGQNHGIKLTNPAQELFRRVRSVNDGHRRSLASVSDESYGQSGRSPSVFSMCSHSISVEPGLTPNLISDGSENELDLTLNGPFLINKNLHHSASPSVLVCIHFPLSEYVWCLTTELYDNILKF